jgi:hypothetical protein
VSDAAVKVDRGEDPISDEWGPICGAYLMEDDWEEGFECSLPPGHMPPHRCAGGIYDVNESTDKNGHKYTWVYEWSYTS